MLCYYRHEQPVQVRGEPDVSTADAAAVLGPLAHKHLRPADQYTYLEPGDVAKDSSGQRFRERFAATDIAWLKRVTASFRASLGYSDTDRGDLFALLTVRRSRQGGCSRAPLRQSTVALTTKCSCLDQTIGGFIVSCAARPNTGAGAAAPR